MTSGCGGHTYLPLVWGALPLAERTGLQIRIGPTLDLVDVDHARVSPESGLRLAADEHVSQVVGDGTSTLALLETCDVAAPSRVLRVIATGHADQIAAGHFDGLLPGGSQTWAYQFPTDNNGSERLIALNGGPTATLPAGFAVVGAYQTLIIGYQASPTKPGPDTAGPLVIIDPASGRVRATVAPAGAAATVGAGLILWTESACTPSLPCMVHRYDLATGNTSARDYHLGLDAGTPGYGLLSPDQRLLAFQLHRPAPDPRFKLGHPGAPSDIGVLNLNTGHLDLVPGIELWAKASPGLMFSPDSRWLIIGLAEGTRTRLLLWHPGLSHPAAVLEVPGLTYFESTPITATMAVSH